MTFEEARLIAIESKRIADTVNTWIGIKPSPDFDELPYKEQTRLAHSISTIVQAMESLGYKITPP